MTCNDADDVLLFPVCRHVWVAAVYKYLDRLREIRERWPEPERPQWNTIPYEEKLRRTNTMHSWKIVTGSQKGKARTTLLRTLEEFV